MTLDNGGLMKSTGMTISEIRREGLHALRERLGVAGMARFLHLFDSGSGDYTRERHAWLEDQTVDEIVQRIQQREPSSK
jgi:hypothetical protein